MSTRNLFLAGCAVIGCSPALASLTLVGNTSPGNRFIDIEIDGQIAAVHLGYLQFQQLDLPTGSRRVRLLDSSTGELIVQDTLLVTAFNSNWLSLGGDGDARPYTTIRSGFIPGLGNEGGRLGVVNAAVDRITSTQRCEAPDGLHAGQTSGNTAYRDVGFSTSSDLFCRFDSTRYLGATVTALPALELNYQPGELRFLAYVGNGSAVTPFQWVDIRNGRALVPALAAEQDLLHVVKSVNYWHDSGRFSQGVSLYEVSRTLAVHGMWNTYAANGRPQWFYLDGGVVDPSGRREVLVSDYVIDASGRRSGTTVGRGTLTYLTCNQAEFQVLFADGSTRAAQFRRSIPVTTCDAVP